MKKVCVLFGGAGYIGTKAIERFIENKMFDRIIVCDIKPTPVRSEIVDYYNIDVRGIIDLELKFDIDIDQSWIYNLAAIHREPGHEREEYFDTNIPGAENINQFAEKVGIKNILFTSSIAPYGRSLDQRKESSQLYAETPYGVSKAIAEKIHQVWQAKDESRNLIIVRPSVIYGPGDPGNVLRMIKGLQKGTFLFPGSTEIIKAHGYVYGLIDSFLFAMEKQDKLIVYNYTENPVVPIGEMCSIVKQLLCIKKPTIKAPMWALVTMAFFIQIFGGLIGKKSSIHPVRVKKAAFPTNIKPQWLIDNGFEFKYGFEKSIKHWKNISPEDF